MADQNLIGDEWERFCAQVYPADLPTEDRADLRRVWFASAISLWATMMEGLEDEAVSSDEKLSHFAAIEAEFDRFESETAAWAIAAMVGGNA